MATLRPTRNTKKKRRADKRVKGRTGLLVVLFVVLGLAALPLLGLWWLLRRNGFYPAVGPDPATVTALTDETDRGPDKD